MSNTAITPPKVHTLWKHVKTQQIYVVVGHCLLEATNEPAVLYSHVNGDGDVWARQRLEFCDGRFLQIEAYVDAEEMPDWADACCEACNKWLEVDDEYTTCDNSGTSECKACEVKRLKVGA